MKRCFNKANFLSEIFSKTYMS